MKKSKPLVDDEGEVRELLVEDLRKFRPLPEVATATSRRSWALRRTGRRWRTRQGCSPGSRERREELLVSITRFAAASSVDCNCRPRELLIEDLRKFRLSRRLQLPRSRGSWTLQRAGRRQRTRKGCSPESRERRGGLLVEHYPFRCCVVCGLQLPASLTVAHLDHRPGNNDPDNLAYLCGTHHWMYDAGLYPIDGYQASAGALAEDQRKAGSQGKNEGCRRQGRTHPKKSAAARKAWQTRRQSAG